MDVMKTADSILKYSVPITDVDPKIQNRIMEVKKIYQKISEVQKVIDEQTASLQRQIKDLEKQTKIFEKEILPVLKTLSDNAIQAEGIFIELKAGKRSPKVGYEFLASRVESSLMTAAEEAITEAAKFAKSMTVTVSSLQFNDRGIDLSKMKTANVFDWLKDRWDALINWVKNLKKHTSIIADLLDQLDKNTMNYAAKALHAKLKIKK